MPNVISLRAGELVSCNGENWVIVHCEDFERVLASRVTDGRHDFLQVADLLPAVFGPPPEGEDGPPAFAARRIRRQSNLDEKMTPKTKKSIKNSVREFQFALKVLKAPRAERRELIGKMTKKFKYNQATAYRRIKIAAIHQNSDALRHAVRSDVGVRRVQADVIEVIRKHLADHRFIATPKTLPDILVLINGCLRKNGLKEISLTTLTSFEKETTLKQKLEAQGQKKKASDAFRPKVGHLPNSIYPLAIAQVDHTPLQICFVDEDDRQPIGDAWLTLVIDTYSRMVLGFFLSFDAPSTLSTGMALAHAFLPKEDYLRSIGVSGAWPCWGFPDVAHVDNATELNGKMMHGARKRYRFTLRDRPVGSPNFGGHVESAFKTFMYELKSIPGTKFSNPVERGEYDSEGRAIFTIAEFEKFFTDFLVNDYHLKKHTGDGMDGSVPLLKWKQGIFDGDTKPPTGLPDRPADPLSLRISLMPVERRVVRNSIVNVLSHEYHSGRLTLISDGVDLKKPTEERKFEVRYDPRNISKVWLYDEEAERYIELEFADKRLGPISLWEDRARRKRRGDQSDQFKDQRYESKLRREEMKEQAAKKTKQQRLEAEKERQRAAGALVQPPPPAARKPGTGKKPLDPARLQAMRDKVRPAAVSDIFSKEKGNG
jgi:putative transposase